MQEESLVDINNVPGSYDLESRTIHRNSQFSNKNKTVSQKNPFKKLSAPEQNTQMKGTQYQERSRGSSVWNLTAGWNPETVSICRFGY